MYATKSKGGTSYTCPCMFPGTSPAGWGWCGPVDTELWAAEHSEAVQQIQLSESVKDFKHTSLDFGLSTSLVPLSLMPYLSLVFLIRSEKLLTNFRISCSSAHKTEKWACAIFSEQVGMIVFLSFDTISTHATCCCYYRQEHSEDTTAPVRSLWAICYISACERRPGQTLSYGVTVFVWSAM